MEFTSRQELLEALKSSDPSKREKAICEAGTLDDPSLLPHLLEFLNDPTPRIRWRTLQSIGKLGAQGKAGEVLGLLKDESPLVRAEAAKVIGLSGETGHAPALSPLLEDQDLQVRCRTIEALGELGEPGKDLLERILTLLQEEDKGIRMHAAMALGKCRYVPALPQLTHHALQDPSHNVRGLSAWSLGNLGDERAIDPLIDALGDDGESVRIYAYQALSSFGNKALPALKSAQAAKGESIRPHVERLLEDLSLEGAE
jgi:HEAT repeat protein